MTDPRLTRETPITFENLSSATSALIDARKAHYVAHKDALDTMRTLEAAERLATLLPSKRITVDHNMVYVLN